MSQFADLMQTVAVPTLLRVFGDPVTHTNGDGDEALIQAAINQQTDALSLTDAGAWPQTEWTAQVAKTAGVARGETLTQAGTVTADDPYPDDVVWRVGDIINDDGFIVTLAIRREP